MTVPLARRPELRWGLCRFFLPRFCQCRAELHRRRAVALERARTTST
uniref:Uncharacterized protein n=1 Tax=Anguilla anguilla TaxID=7936 RepID=A0A0E9XUG3_ANGAN